MKSKLCIFLSFIMIFCMTTNLFVASAAENDIGIDEKVLTRVANDDFKSTANEKNFDYYYYQAEKKLEYGIFSIQADVKVDALSMKKGGVILSSKSDRARGGGIHLEIDDTLHLTLKCISDDYSHIFSEYTFPEGEFVNLCLIYDDTNSELNLYIDGEIKESIKNISLINDPCNMVYRVFSSDASIGHDDRFHGKISSISLYGSTIPQEIVAKGVSKTPLTQEEMKEFDLMAKWNIADDRAWKVEDESLNDNDLILATHDYRFESSFPADSEVDYSFVVLPDTQYLTLWQKNRFYKMVDWINRNVEKLKIKFVIHVGDITDNSKSPAGKRAQWQTASAYMSMLDGKVPYSFIVGNHDFDDHYSWVQSRNTEYFNEAFPYSKYSERADFGGAYKKGQMDNTYYKLDINGVKYIILALEYCPRMEVLDWANDVCSSHPDHRIIVSTHTYLEPDASFDNRSFTSMHGIEANTSEDVYEMLVKKHSNIMAVISGHIGQNNLTTRVDRGEKGNRILDLVSNFQNLMDDDPRYNPQGYKFDEAILTVINFNESKKKAWISCYMPEYDKFFNLQNMMEYDFNDSKNTAISASTEHKKGGCGSAVEGNALVVAGSLLLAIAMLMFTKRTKTN